VYIPIFCVTVEQMISVTQYDVLFVAHKITQGTFKLLKALLTQGLTNYGLRAIRGQRQDSIQRTGTCRHFPQ
jgi:hypothetical protein